MRNRSNSLVCLLLAAVAGFAQQPAATRPSEPSASVAGEVRDSLTGAPIERAHVWIGLYVNGNQERYGAFTNAEGRFLITGIPAGSYVPALDRTGYVAMPSTSPLPLAAGEKKEGVKLKLTPTGAIIGRVLDADGAPMESITVTALAGTNSERTAVTDDRGIFRLGGLRPGKFRIRASPMNLPIPPEIRTDGSVEIHYASTFHPSGLDAKSATLVEVKAATEVTGVDIRLIRTPIVRVAGKVSGIPPGQQRASISIRPQGQNGGSTRPDGTFEIWRLDPGKYTFTAQLYGSNGMQLSSADLPVEVGESDVENLALQLMEPQDIKGQVEFEDEEARTPPPTQARQMQASSASGTTPSRPVPQTRRIMLRSPDGSVRVPQADLTDDGSFTLLRVTAGKYRVVISNARVYVKSMRLGQTSFEGPQLDLSYGSGGAPLVLHVASAKGVVSGVVRDEKGPIAGVRVALAEDTTDRVYPVFTGSKEDGSYAFNGVAPGKYKVFVIEDSQMSLMNQAGLEDFDDVAEKIEVHDQETVTKDLKKK